MVAGDLLPLGSGTLVNRSLQLLMPDTSVQETNGGTTT